MCTFCLLRTEKLSNHLSAICGLGVQYKQAGLTIQFLTNRLTTEGDNWAPLAWKSSILDIPQFASSTALISWTCSYCLTQSSTRACTSFKDRPTGTTRSATGLPATSHFADGFPCVICYRPPCYTFMFASLAYGHTACSAVIPGTSTRSVEAAGWRGGGVTCRAPGIGHIATGS